jgi:phasin
MPFMNETSATTPKTAKHMADAFDASKFAMPKIEVPAEFREMTDKGVAHARDTCAKALVASEEAGDLLKKTYATVARGTTDYNLKLIEIARTNARAAFDYAQELLGVKSPSEFIELSTAHLRKQFDSVAGQTQELCALAQKAASDAAEPIKTGVSKAFNKTP